MSAGGSGQIDPAGPIRRVRGPGSASKVAARMAEAHGATEDRLAFTVCRFLDTGYCSTRESNLFQGGRRIRVECRCMVALLRHPAEGWGLWDTGYSRWMIEATRSLPNRLYRWAAPQPPQPDLSVLSQLPAHGLAADDIRWIVLSHLHGDHVAGVRDFQAARLYATQEACNCAASRRGLASVAKAYLPGLLPNDFAARLLPIRSFDGPALDGLGPAHDLFGDGSARLFPLPGHARGQIGMLADTPGGPILFVADSVYHRDSIPRMRPPGRLTNLIADEPGQVLPTIRRLNAFHAAQPGVPIFPTHCSDTYREWIVEGRPPC